MSDNRIEARIQLSYFLRVYERGTQKKLGQILDITPNGLNLLSAEPIESGTIKSILIDLPQEIMGKQRLSLTVESRWCKTDINPSYYSIGFKYRELSPESLALVTALMDVYEFGIELKKAFKS